MKRKQEIEHAIRCEICTACDSVHVDMFDEAGDCIATAALPEALWADFIMQFITASNVISRRLHISSGATHPAPEGRQ